MPGSSDTHFVDRDPDTGADQVCLEKIAEKEHDYIGMIVVGEEQHWLKASGRTRYG